MTTAVATPPETYSLATSPLDSTEPADGPTVGSTPGKDDRIPVRDFGGPILAYDLPDFLGREFPSHPGIVGNKLIIQRGLTVTASAPKVGKSRLQMQLALARAYGRPWLGFPTTPGRTLYLNAEIVEEEFQERFRFMMEPCGPIPPGSVFVATTLGDPVYLNEDDGMRRVTSLLQRAKPDLLILDPLTHLYAGNQNDQEEMQTFLHNLRRLRIEHDLAISLVHHLRKPPRDKRWATEVSPHDMAGSSVLHREADAVIIYQGDGRSQIDVQFSLRHAAALDPIRLRLSNGLWWEPDGRPPLPTHLATALRLLEANALSHTEWKKQIRESTHRGDSTIRRDISELMAYCFVRKAPNGLYELTDKGREVMTDMR